MTVRYRYFSGTRAATPYAAGVAALLPEKYPRLTAAQLREKLQAQATRDAKSKNLPNPNCGYGKLDLAAVERLIDNLPAGGL